jgi:hypothetical protein
MGRKNVENTISDKIFDFSCKTIRELRDRGYNNTTDLSDVEFSVVRISKYIISIFKS